MSAVLLGLWKVVKNVGSLSIPIPLWLLVAVWGSWQAAAWWDKTAAIKEAVEKRVTEMVTGAEKAALEAELQVQKDIAQKQKELYMEAARRTAVVQAANARLEAQLNATEERAEDAEARYQEMLEKPLDSNFVTPAIHDRLRNK